MALSEYNRDKAVQAAREKREAAVKPKKPRPKVEKPTVKPEVNEE